jgi:hypothetical protein
MTGEDERDHTTRFFGPHGRVRSMYPGIPAHSGSAVIVVRSIVAVPSLAAAEAWLSRFLPILVSATGLRLSQMLAAFDRARRHLMHGAALVALLGSLPPAAALLIRAAQMSPLALAVNRGMLALCAILLVLMVRSFVAARRAGQAA